MEDGVLQLFGLTIGEVGLVSAAVLLVVEFAKRILPGVFTGWMTLVLSFAVSLAASYKAVGPDWEKVIALAIITIVLAGGGKAVVKKIGNGTS